MTKEIRYMKKKINVVLLMCDQFRGDCLSFAKHPDVKTPYLDSLATNGVFFEQAYSACPSCIPARVALLTGRSQQAHGRVGYQDEIDWNYNHYLAEEFSKYGYQTQCIGKMHVHPPRLLCGFQGLKLHDGYLGSYRSTTIPRWMHQEVSDDYLYDLQNTYDRYADITASGLECNSWVTRPWMYEERLHPTNWVVDQSIRFLQTRDRTKPFFLMTSFVRPHQPLDAPQAYYDMYKDKPLAKSSHGDWVDASLTKQFGTITDSIYGCSDATLQQDAKAGYYASITHVDHQIGRLITSLKEDGSFDDTVIVFLSDHGEMLFDHNLWRKVFPYEGSTHIPMLFHIGKNVKEILPHRMKGIVELRDVMPTLLELADIPIPQSVDGLSLVPTLYNQASIPRTYLHGEHSFHSNLSNHWIVSETDKYIWFSETGIEQYFNLKEDPKEEHNRIQDENAQKRIQELRAHLIYELKDREEGYSDGTRLYTGKTPRNMLSTIIN